MLESDANCLVITFGSVEFDSRVQRQVAALGLNFRVTLLGPIPRSRGWWDNVDELIDIKADTVGFLRSLSSLEIFRAAMGLFLLLRFFRWFHWSPRYLSFWALKALARHDRSGFDMVVVNDVDPIPLALRISRGAPVVADLHEFAPGEVAIDSLQSKLTSRYRSWICRKYLARCAAITVPSGSVGDLYRSDFGVESEVVRSVPGYVDIGPSAIQEGNIQLVHHGFYSPTRGVELLLEAFAGAFEIGTLNLVLSGAPTSDLKVLATKLEIPESRLVFHQFVSPEHLIPFLNRFDVEVIFIPTDVVNEKAALPNKFFEAIQARLGVLSGPMPEVAREIERHVIGAVTTSFRPDDLARELRSLTAERVRYWKKQSNQLAKELNWENEAPDYPGYLVRTL